MYFIYKCPFVIFRDALYFFYNLQLTPSLKPNYLATSIALSKVELKESSNFTSLVLQKHIQFLSFHHFHKMLLNDLSTTRFKGF